MKRIQIFLLCFITSLFVATTLHAQPSAVKKAAQSVFSLTTFRPDGSIHTSTYGVFVGTDGKGVAMWHAFDGANSAVVVDAKGRTHEVDVMLGVSELYDLCEFRVKDKAPLGLSLTSSDTPATSVYLVGYDLKKSNIKRLTPERSEKFMTSYNYYVFNDNDVSNTDLGCPIVNDKGELLGIMQRNKNGGQAFSADARIVNTFTLNGLSINSQTLRATGIRTALPDDEKQAIVMLMFAAQQSDSTKYRNYIQDFIAQFPQSTEGYKAEATLHLKKGELDKADEAFNQSVKNVTKKDEAYFDYAQAMYRAVAYAVDTTYTKWSYQRALELIREAEKLNPVPGYKHLEAQIIYSQGDYQKALDLFTALQKTELGKHGEVYFEAAQCKTQLKAPQQEIMLLLDSAVNVQKGPISAPYILARAQVYDKEGQYRKAFLDYLTYDSLMNFRATPEFYYAKYKCEMNLKQYQLALQDIAHAIVLDRTEPTYYAEMASLQLMINKLEDAVKTCDLGLTLTKDYPDLYIIKGVALCELHHKQEGLQTLEQAKLLGDARAEGLIEKYKKKK